MTKSYTPQQILALPMEQNDAFAKTIGQYLFALTQRVWKGKDEFDGKRPFGNSDWDADIYYALVKAEAVEGNIDEHGWITGQNSFEIEALMDKLFSFLMDADPSTFQLPPEPKDWYVVGLDLDEIVGNTVEDAYSFGFTEEDAKKEVERRKINDDSLYWVAIHIPSPQLNI